MITGGSRGLGRNTAINLVRRGVDDIFQCGRCAEPAAFLSALMCEHSPSWATRIVPLEQKG